MNSSKDANTNCTETENGQIQVPPQQRRRIQFNSPLLKNSLVGIIAIRDQVRPSERRKTADCKAPPDRSLRETFHDNPQSSGSANLTRNTPKKDNNSIKTKVECDNQGDNVSRNAEKLNNCPDSQATSIKNIKQGEYLKRTAERTNNSFQGSPKPSIKNNTQAHNATQYAERTNINFQDSPKQSIKNNTQAHYAMRYAERTNNNHQDHQRTHAKYNNQADNAKKIVENVNITKCNTSSTECPKDQDSVLVPQINSGTRHKETTDTDDGWGTVVESGDYHAEDVWESERGDGNHKQVDWKDRSKTPSCFKSSEKVEHGNAIPFDHRQNNYKNNRLEITDDKTHNYNDNKGSLQVNKKDSNNWNVSNRNIYPPSKVEPKANDEQCYSTKTESQESKNKEYGRSKLDDDSKTGSYDGKNSSKINLTDKNSNRNAYAHSKDSLSNVQLKTTNTPDNCIETIIQKSRSKESYRKKIDVNGIETRSHDDNYSSKLNQSNFNNRNISSNTNAPFSRAKTEMIDKQDSCVKNNNQDSECVESGWPELGLDDGKTHGCDSDWTWENSMVNQKEIKRNESKSYHRSISASLPQSSIHSSERVPRRDGRGDEPDRKFLPESSRFQQDRSKGYLNRSTSFTDRTHTKDANRNNGTPSPNHFSTKKTNNRHFDRTENQGRAVSNETASASDWQKNRSVDKQENLHDNGCRISEPSKLAASSRLSDNQFDLKEENVLKDESKGICSDDEWITMSETSEVSTIVLDEDCSENFEGKRVVTGFSVEDLKITVQPKVEADHAVTKENQDIPKNSSKIDELLQLPFLDPLQDSFDFFDDCPDPFIPAPQPTSAIAHLAAFSPAVKQTPESRDCSPLLESNTDEPSTGGALLKGIPDARHIQEVSSYLTEVESEKSVCLETSKKILKDLLKAVDRTMQSNWDKVSDMVYIYGSYVSGLAVSTSNINCALKAGFVKNSYLFQLQRGLSKEFKGYQVEPFDEDKDPKKSKICFTEMKTGIPCELGFHSSTVANYLALSKMLHNVCEFDRRIKTLLVATRIWAEVCLIHEAEEGKLHTVGYSLLMLHFLQGLEKPLLPVLNTDPSVKYGGLNQLEEKNESSVGELWLAFLKYYSEFNWEDNVVTVNSKTSVSKSSKHWERSFIAVEDPFTQNNIGDSVVSEQCAECIFACFKASYQYFSTPVDYEDSESSDSGITDSPSNSLKKEVFSFNYISFDQNVPTVCEKCEEQDETCNKCRPRKEVILQPLLALSESSLECVNRTLHDVYKEFMLPDSQTEERIAFVKKLEFDVRKMFPGATMTLFGSTVNGFGFKKSDLDICMTFNTHKPESNYENSLLNKIVRFLRKKPQYENIYGLYHAKIPIVKFHVIQQDWHCDLSLYNILAVHNSKLLRKYSMYDERCCILGCAMKLLAKKACLDDTRSLSSYSYILTVIHYLQQVEPPVLPVFPVDHKEVFDEKLRVPKEVLDHRNYWLTDNIDQLRNRYRLHPKNNSTVGELWLGLLDFYSRYDGANAITITQKEPLPSTNLHRCARLLNIQDPFLEKDNLGCILNDLGAAETRKVLGRARLLFGKEIPKEHKNKPKLYYFSSSNLTGHFIKEIECDGCGGFGHTKSDCLKADPFKRSKFKMRVPKAVRRLQKLKG